MTSYVETDFGTVMTSERKRVVVFLQNLYLSSSFRAKKMWVWLVKSGVASHLNNIHPSLNRPLRKVISFSFTVTPEFVEKPEDTVAVQGDTVNFTCSIKSSPESVIIEWLLNDILILNDNPRYNVSTHPSHVKDGSVISQSILIISDVSGNESGHVACHIAEDVGQSQANLNVLGKDIWLLVHSYLRC